MVRRSFSLAQVCADTNPRPQNPRIRSENAVGRQARRRPPKTRPVAYSPRPTSTTSRTSRDPRSAVGRLHQKIPHQLQVPRRVKTLRSEGAVVRRKSMRKLQRSRSKLRSRSSAKQQQNLEQARLSHQKPGETATRRAQNPGAVGATGAPLIPTCSTAQNSPTSLRRNSRALLPIQVECSLLREERRRPSQNNPAQRPGGVRESRVNGMRGSYLVAVARTVCRRRSLYLLSKRARERSKAMRLKNRQLC